ncbi:MAG: ABC transporter substrate-binding protein [Hyphomicrobiales bacterium]|nr:ABC transporter substrate-binding protein [Hyphomicrobiales bacterium]
MAEQAAGGMNRRTLVKTVVLSGAALTAGLPARALLAAGKAPETVRVSFFLETKPTMIAKGEGWFDKLSGSKCAWTEAGSGAEINAAFAGKSVDIGLAIGSSPTASGISQRLPYELVGMVDNIGPAEEMVVRKAANIKSVADFKGKKVATPFGSTSHFRLLGFLKVNNLTQKDVTVLDMKPDAEVAAWTRGDIDAVYVWSPAKAKMLEAGGELFTTYKDLDAKGYVIADLIVAGTEFSKAYPDALTGFLVAYRNALKMWQTSPDEAAAIVGKQAGVSAEVAKHDMEEYDFVPFEKQLTAEWLGPPGKAGKFADVLKRTADFLVEQKSIKSAPDLSAFQAATNTTFLAQAVKAAG